MLPVNKATPKQQEIELTQAIESMESKERQKFLSSKISDWLSKAELSKEARRATRSYTQSEEAPQHFILALFLGLV